MAEIKEGRSLGELFQSSRSGLKKASITPEKTTETLQEDKRWLKEQSK